MDGPCITNRQTRGANPMTMKSATQMVTDAKGRVENLSPAALGSELATGNVLLVDLRETEELRQHGRIAGAIHAPRGMLEFYADPASAYHRPDFDPDRRTILYCASGGRS